MWVFILLFLCSKGEERDLFGSGPYLHQVWRCGQALHRILWGASSRTVPKTLQRRLGPVWFPHCHGNQSESCSFCRASQLRVSDHTKTAGERAGLTWHDCSVSRATCIWTSNPRLTLYPPITHLTLSTPINQSIPMVKYNFNTGKIQKWLFNCRSNINNANRNGQKECF